MPKKTPYQSLTFMVHIDIHVGETVNPRILARAIYRVIELATENDIEGAEVIDSRIGQVQVHYIPKD